VPDNVIPSVLYVCWDAPGPGLVLLLCWPQQPRSAAAPTPRAGVPARGPKTGMRRPPLIQLPLRPGPGVARRGERNVRQ
jgi:hypothetical protein